MDPIKIDKIRAVNNYKRHQLLNNLFIYSWTALTCCTLFCSSPFWFPYLSSSMKIFLSVSFPKIASIFFSYKFVFIVGNLIVVALIGESKIFSSDPSPFSDVLYDDYVNRTQSLQSSSITKVKRSEGKTVNYAEENVKRIGKEREDVGAMNCAEENEDIDGNNDFILPAEELSKRADDFIARVNKQRRLEARVRSPPE